MWDSRLVDYGASPCVPRLTRRFDLGRIVDRRRQNFSRLASRLSGRVTMPLVELAEGVCPLFFPILVDDKLRAQKDLATLGIQSVNLWDESHPSCPSELANELSVWREHCLELPIHQGLAEQAIDRIAAAVHNLGIAELTKGPL